MFFFEKGPKTNSTKINTPKSNSTAMFNVGCGFWRGRFYSQDINSGDKLSVKQEKTCPHPAGSAEKNSQKRAKTNTYLPSIRKVGILDPFSDSVPLSMSTIGISINDYVLNFILLSRKYTTSNGYAEVVLTLGKAVEIFFRKTNDN